MSTASTPVACRFTGKVALITGSNSGLGEALAVRLALEGACVILTGRDPERLEAASKRCQYAAKQAEKSAVKSSEFDEKVLAIPGDIALTETRQELLDKTLKTFGKLDILVNNAGVFPALGGLENATEEKFDEVFATNVKAGFFLTQLAASSLEKTKGNVLFISSSLSQTNMPAACVYSASKAAIDSLVRNLSLTFGPRGVRVNGINPTYIPTRGARAFAPSPDMVEEIAAGMAAKLGPSHPLGRCATVDEFVESATFLISPQATATTGESLFIDCGARWVSPYSDPNTQLGQ